MIYTLLVLAAGTVVFRPYFPNWLNPETYGLTRGTTATASPWLSRSAQRLARAELQQNARILIVGDSVVKSCPWPVDKLSREGMSTRGLHAQLTAFIGEREYDCIVLWPGTWDLMRGGSPDDYVDAVVELAELAGRHAQHIILLTPMPSGTVQTLTDANRRHVLSTTRAVRTLRKRLPELTIVDMGEFRAMAERGNDMKGLFLDNLHISEKGYDVLNAEFLRLAALTIPLRPA